MSKTDILSYDSVFSDVKQIQKNLTETPAIAMVLGTGFSDFASKIDVEFEIAYDDLEYMPSTTNPMHPGKFIVGKLFGRQVICMAGRIHVYEGYDASEVAFPIYVMRWLGARHLIVTNAAGAINTDYKEKQFCVIKDHINFTGKTPIPFNIDERVGIPCPDMTYAYHPRMRSILMESANTIGLEVQEGVYIGVLGPAFETPAEIKAFRIMGADLVGMSTIPEVVAAQSCGMETAGISLMTNMAAGVLDQRISCDDINNMGSGVMDEFSNWLEVAFREF